MTDVCYSCGLLLLALSLPLRTAPSCAPAWRGTWSLRPRRHSVPGRRSATCSPARSLEHFSIQYASEVRAEVHVACATPHASIALLWMCKRGAFNCLLATWLVSVHLRVHLCRSPNSMHTTDANVLEDDGVRKRKMDAGLAMACVTVGTSTC